MVYPWHSDQFNALLGRLDRLPHALLLRGREGIGKLAFAEALARSLLCESPLPGRGACGRCAACAWMKQGSHPDFRRLEPESLAEEGDPEQGGGAKASRQIPVERIRSIADFINLSGHRGRAKVALIHPAEALNVNAANALLKNLEEPPPRTYFLLVAHRWHQLLPTIRSRCEQIALPSPSRAVTLEWLKRQDLNDAELALGQAGGAPLVAVKFDAEYWKQRGSLLNAFAAADFDALGVADRLRETSPALVVGWLQKWSFDLVTHKVTGRVHFNPDFVATVTSVAARVDLIDVLRFHRQMVQMQRIVAHPLNPRLLLEHLLLTYSALLRRVPRLQHAG